MPTKKIEIENQIQYSKVRIWLYYKKKYLKSIIKSIKHNVEIRYNSTLKKQIRNPFSIPILIINFNQLFYLKQLVSFLNRRGFENVVIIDNNSTYPPLLEYYKEIGKNVIIERLDKNYGHMVLYENQELFEKYCKGFYCLTDSDIVPNENLPQNFLSIMLKTLKKNISKVNKVGFALTIKDIPKHYKYRDKVIKWESQFWENKICENTYIANIDTTFALYLPSYDFLDQMSFYEAIRLSGNFEAKHGGWYCDFNNLTDEESFYLNTANNSSSWMPNQNGEIKTIYN